MVHELLGLSLVNPSLHILDGLAYQRESSLAPESSLQPPSAKLLLTADPNTAQSSAFTQFANILFFWTTSISLVPMMSSSDHHSGMHGPSILGFLTYVTHYWKHLDTWILFRFQLFARWVHGLGKSGLILTTLEVEHFRHSWGTSLFFAWQRTHSLCVVVLFLLYLLPLKSIHI